MDKKTTVGLKVYTAKFRDYSCDNSDQDAIKENRPYLLFGQFQERQFTYQVSKQPKKKPFAQ
ncbi:MAG: hypothetical protein EZS28_043400 [Streblomastix strix]|uniref:Uncharacterized protein n=1 Tax=Streblomastix strix TaxID=222440 RepID=A0A5J4TT29_9EUKA|nr:MAG: hypothetical protein EZS28_043400 [Streblomastix strix]